MVTALVCTRNRGSSVTATILTLLANTHPNFEVLVIDQSVDTHTTQAIQPLLTDARLRYVPQDARGLGVARNLGLAEARGEIIAMTDDDCEAPPHWLETMAAIFENNPRVAVAFCNVNAAPHDTSAGFIPSYRRSGCKLLLSSLDKCAARGIGAGIAVNRKSVLALGGFDEMLGAGAHFPSCEDGDIAVRALLHGYYVYETDIVAVEHFGFRTWEEGRSLARRDWLGIGASYVKPLKCGYWYFAIVPAYELVCNAIWPMIWDLLRLRKPQGFGRVTAFIQGFMQGWRTPVDPKTLLFRSTGVNSTENTPFLPASEVS